MKSKVYVLGGLLGQWSGNMVRAGFTEAELKQAFTIAIQGLDSVVKAEVDRPDLMADITKMMADMGYRLEDAGVFGTVFDRNGVPHCDCAKCRARRGAEHQDERNDI